MPTPKYPPDRTETVIALRDIAMELKSLTSVLTSIWTLLAPDQEPLVPHSLTDEYISIEEASRRLRLPPYTIKQWIAEGIRNPKRGWKQGVHYIVLDFFDVEDQADPDMFMKRYQQIIRIPWNFTMRHITLFEQKKRKVQVIDLVDKAKAKATRYSTRTFKILDEEED